VLVEAAVKELIELKTGAVVSATIGRVLVFVENVADVVVLPAASVDSMTR
jgi:hypothetical protein